MATAPAASLLELAESRRARNSGRKLGPDDVGIVRSQLGLAAKAAETYVHCGVGPVSVLHPCDAVMVFATDERMDVRMDASPRPLLCGGIGRFRSF